MFNDSLINKGKGVQNLRLLELFITFLRNSWTSYMCKIYVLYHFEELIVVVLAFCLHYNYMSPVFSHSNNAPHSTGAVVPQVTR